MTAAREIMGPARNRVDGRLKVTGGAKYAVEFEVPNCAYAWPVGSNIAKGKILAIDASAAQKVPGVLLVLTHKNVPKPKNAQAPEERNSGKGIRNEHRLPLGDDRVHYAGQYVAIVVAKTIEAARQAGELVRVSYAPEEPALRMEQASSAATKPDKNHGAPVQLAKGELEPALTNGGVIKVEQTYVTPVETHNPIEMSGTIALWEAEDKLTLYDATQFVKGVQSVLARAWNLPTENVRVISLFVGGAFGCKGAVWPHVLIAAMAAKAAGVPVKFHVPRKFMFTGAGHRPETRQWISLAATKDGKLQAMQHVTGTSASTVGEYIESCGTRSTGVMYNSPVIRVEEKIYPVNVSTPTFMRAPGECPGTFALETALDELAYALKMDPIALRVVNHADNHPMKNVPFSAKHLKECYRLGAERFGWSKRKPEPRSMRDGDLMLGWGMATATYPAHKSDAAAKVRLRQDGSATVQCATHDLGTGAYTAFTQISSEQLGVPFEKVTFELGKSDYPWGPVAGGSNSTATVGTALHEVAQLLHRSLAEIAIKDPKSSLYQANPDEIEMVEPGRLGLKSHHATSDGFIEILKRAGRDALEVETKVKQSEENNKFAFQSWGAHFAEVKIDPLLPRVQVTRVVSVMNCGRIVTSKPARSQIMGGVVMGIGMALMEETVYDDKTGLPATRNLADYHVPTNLDIPDIDVQFVGEPDFKFNPVGCRGMGEIGITGIAAAVGNAVFHATGRRIRQLPITLDKLMS